MERFNEELKIMQLETEELQLKLEGRLTDKKLAELETKISETNETISSKRQEIRQLDDQL